MNHESTKVTSLGALSFCVNAFVLFCLSPFVAAGSANGGVGLAFLLEKEGFAPVYIGGVIHSLREPQRNPPGIYLQIYETCGVVGFEIDVESDPSLDSVDIGFFPEPKESAGSQFSEETLIKVGEFCSKFGSVDLEEFLAASPVYAHFILQQALSSSAGYSSKFATDNSFRLLAQSEKKKLVYLESASDQIKAYEKLPVGYFEEVVARNADTPVVEYRKRRNRQYSLWLKGDFHSLEQDVLKKSSPLVREHILRARNAAWVSKIYEIVEGGEPVFLLVGAGHLLGPESLLGMMEAEGFEVTQVKSFEQIVGINSRGSSPADQQEGAKSVPQISPPHSSQGHEEADISR